MSLSTLRKSFKRFRRSKRYWGRCNICGCPTVFLDNNALTLTKLRFRNDLKCIWCGSIARQRAIASVFCELYQPATKNLKAFSRLLAEKNIAVHNAAAQEITHTVLSTAPGYTCSEFFAGVDSGQFHNGIRCEDLQELSFQDETLDLFISEDVLEHVRKPEKAFQSIYRVLKSGGYHVFTVPIYGEQTLVRVDTSGNEDKNILPPVYHGDPLNANGVLAYNDFGEDITVMADKHGFESRLMKFNCEDKNYKCGHVIVSRKIK